MTTTLAILPTALAAAEAQTATCTCDAFSPCADCKAARKLIRRARLQAGGPSAVPMQG